MPVLPIWCPHAGVVEQAHDKRGLVIIVSNEFLPPSDGEPPRGLEPLPGAKKDGERMSGLFDRLGFATLWRQNVSVHEFENIITEASRYDKYPEQYECLVFVISSHGKVGGHLYMQDGETIAIDEMIGKFLPENALRIGKLPKIFFIDACRGDDQMRCVPVPKGSGSDESRDKRSPPVMERGATVEVAGKMPPKGNYLVAYPTIHNYKAYEKQGEGGIWMKILAEMIESMPTSSIPDVLTAVSEKMMKMIEEDQLGEGYAMDPEYTSKLHTRVCLGCKQAVTDQLEGIIILSQYIAVLTLS